MKPHELNLKRAYVLSGDLDDLLRRYNQIDDELIGASPKETEQLHEEMAYVKSCINLLAKELYKITEQVEPVNIEE